MQDEHATNDTAPLHSPVLALAASPEFGQDYTCYAASTGGLYCSTNAGRSWQSLQAVADVAVYAIALSPSFNADRCLFGGLHGGVVRSRDAGQTWAVSLLPTPPPTISAIAVSPNFARDHVVFIGTDGDGVFRSDDGGASWSSWNFGLLDHHVLSMVVSPNFANDEMLFVGTGTGVFKSKNGARAWREVAFPAAPVLALAISPELADDGLLFGGSEASGIFTSADHGEHWSPAALPDLSVNAICLVPSPEHGLDLLVATSEALHVSHDQGKTWALWAAIADVLSVAAPYGLSTEQPVLVGLATGGAEWVSRQ